MPSLDSSSGGHEQVDPNETPTVGTRIATFLLGWPLSAAFAVWCVAILAFWIPNYLNLPWYTDHDHFAMIAQRWAGGFLPFRDTFSMQFPGEIYLFYLLGKVTGWGNSVAFYAVDAGMVLTLGILLLAWGRKESGRWLPGLVGFAVFLTYYASQTYAVTSQRDWHGMFFAGVSLLVLELLPGRSGRIISGIFYGIALSFRPQFVLLAPALAIGLIHGDRDPKTAVRRTVLAWLEWGVVAAVTLSVAFVPLILSGVFDDFLHCLRTISYGGDYNSRTALERIKATLEILAQHPAPIVILLTILCMGSGANRPSSRVSWMVVLALFGAVLYSPISPRPHPNYQIPVNAMLAIATTFALSLVDPRRSRSIFAAVTILLVGVTWYYPNTLVKSSAKAFVWDFRGARPPAQSDGLPLSNGPIEALKLIRTRELSEIEPYGWFEFFQPAYKWGDIRRLILHLRENTTPETPVAVLVFECSTAINGAVPRLSPLPCDVVGLVTFHEFLDADIAALKAVGPCVVVLDPSAQENPIRTEFKKLIPKLGPLLDLVHRDFRLEATIGPFEVWRKTGSTTAAPSMSPEILDVPRPSVPGRN